jgi:hypothetical protein
MMGWIKCSDRLPEKCKYHSKFVLVTFKGYIYLGFYVHDPKEYGCCIDDDPDGKEREIHGFEPHWDLMPDGCLGPLIDGEEYFWYGCREVYGLDSYKDYSDAITHWMELPEPPRNDVNN